MFRLLDYFSEDLAIDLGTANTLVYAKGSGEIILNEPSVVAVYTPNHHGASRRMTLSDSILAVGHEAKQMVGRTPANIRAVRPLKDGVIADFRVTEVMLKHFINKVQSRRMFVRPRIVVGVPCESTPVERRAIREASISAGGREVYLIEEPLAVAIGMNLPVSEPTGSMVVDIGGGTTEIGVISMGGLVGFSTLRFAGDLFDQKIGNYLEDKYGLQIGQPTAEKIKQTIGTAWERTQTTSMNIHGSNHRGSMRRQIVKSNEIYEVLKDSLNEIINGVRKELERAPPELRGDIMDRGILLAGGGALLRDIDKQFNERLGIPVIIAEDPLTCVARGCGRALEQTNMLARAFATE